MNIVDPGMRLSIWRLILSEFDFWMKCRKRSQKHLDNAISRLPTYGYATLELELEMLHFLVEVDAATSRYSVINTVDVPSRMDYNWDPYENREDEQVLRLLEVLRH